MNKFWKNQELLAKIPQPSAAPYPIGHFFWLRKHKSHLSKLAFDNRSQYGDVMLARLGPRNIVIISDVNMVKQILQHDPDNYNKAKFLSTLSRWLGKSLLLSEGAAWAKKRELMSHAFKRSKLATFLPTFHGAAQELGELWETEVIKKGEAIDLYDYFTRLTLDVITRTSFSYNVQAVKSKQMTEAAHHMLDILNGLEAQASSVPSLLAPQWLYFHYITNGKKFERATNAFTELTEGVIQKRMEKIQRKEPPFDRGLDELDAMVEAGTAPEMDLLDLMLLGAHESAKEKGFPSIQDLSQEVQLFLFAGHETTSTTMAWMSYFLSKHPEVEAKMIEEINQVVGSEGKVTVRTLSNLKYMTQVIKETLRLKSPVFGFSRVPKEDVELGKYTIPAGTQILVNSYAIHRKEEYWGENWAVFNPDRQRPDIVRPQFSWIPFAAGPRNCIGQQFAMMEIKTVMSYLLPRFRFELVNEPTDITKVLLRPGNLRVRIHARN